MLFDKIAFCLWSFPAPKDMHNRTPMDNSAPTLGAPGTTSDTAAPAGAATVNQNPQRSYTNAILVRRNQKGNPLMEHLRNVPWQYGDILADYEVGRTTGVLFLR
jgi:DNA excision repair protein ERCC-1